MVDNLANNIKYRVSQGAGHQENCIRTVSKSLENVAITQPSRASKKKFHSRLLSTLSKRFKRRAVRYSILSANIVLLVAVLLFVLNSQPSTNVVSQSSALTTTSQDQIINPLDQLSSADIAVNVARITNLDEQNAAANHADSANAQLGVSAAEQTIVAKPQIVATEFKSSKDIESYTTVLGDTIAKLAAKFNVTSDTIKWSNNLDSDTIPAGKVIYVLPGVNGIIHVVQNGETPASLATKYHSNKEQIVAYNDAEIAGLKVGQRIIIPNGQVFAAVTPTYSFPSFLGGSFTASYGSNGYDFGYCTWYVANKISVPSNWGNANTWAYWAKLTPGWLVSNAPKVGAVGQTTGGYLGHVAVVEAVSADGTKIKYSDMNGLAGYGNVGYSDWVPISHFNNYIYH